MRIASLGTFDVENFGDLLFPLLLERKLRGFDPELELVAVAPLGHATGVWGDCLPAISFPQFLERASEFDAIIVGGGNIIHADPSLVRDYATGGLTPALAYAELWIGAALVAWREGLPLCWNAPGIPGDLRGAGVPLAAWAVEQVDYLSVRDRASAEHLPLSGRQARVVVDPALEVAALWTAAELDEAYDALFEEATLARPERSIVFHLNARYAAEPPEETARELAAIAEDWNAMPILLALGPCHGDGELVERIGVHLDRPHLRVPRPPSLRAATACIARSVAYFGSSLHGMITALAFGTPGLVVASPSKPKFLGLLEQLGATPSLVQDWATARAASPALAAQPRQALPALGTALATLEDHGRALFETSSGVSARSAASSPAPQLPLPRADGYRGLSYEPALLARNVGKLIDRIEQLSTKNASVVKALGEHRDRLAAVRADAREQKEKLGDLDRELREVKSRSQAMERELELARVEVEQAFSSELRWLEAEQRRLSAALQRAGAVVETYLGSLEWAWGDRAVSWLLRASGRARDAAESPRLRERLRAIQHSAPASLEGGAGPKASAVGQHDSVALMRSRREGLRREVGILQKALADSLADLEALLRTHRSRVGRVLVRCVRWIGASAHSDARKSLQELSQGKLRAASDFRAAVPTQVGRGGPEAAPPGSASRNHAAVPRVTRDAEHVERLARLVEASTELLELISRSRKWQLADAAARSWRSLRRKHRGPDLEHELARIATMYEELRVERREAVQRPAPVPAPSRSGPARPDSVADVVVCIHNAPEDVRRCLDSIARHTNLRHHHLILVDDGSAPQTQRIVIEAVNRLGARYRRHDEAQGYTRAANRGIELGTADHVVLLNSDTVVAAGWLERLIACAEAPPVQADGAPVGCVGPLSNAASWQSIPRTHDEQGWVVNELPAGVSVDEYAQAIARTSPRLYPEVPLVNGFCYLIRREALDAAGLLDEETFPRGYGEEDDFSIRLLDLGFRHRIADDCYVFHAKSKSFTREGRARLVESAKVARAAKHGKRRIQDLTRDLARSEDLLRARTVAALAATDAPPPHRGDMGRGRSLGWLMPYLSTVGGVRRTIEMTARLQAWGFDVTIYTPTGEREHWLPIAARVASFADLKQRELDILVGTDPEVVEPFLAARARLRVVYHLAAYNRYRERSKALSTYYAIGEKALHIANSHWTQDQIREYCQVERIIPGGIARHLFHPVRTVRRADVVCHGSKRLHKGTGLIEEATKGYRLLRLASFGASQEELAGHICSGRVFASACRAEGFNFSPLEAMACGVPVAMTDDGGSRDYARGEENAVVVPNWGDPAALRAAIERALDDGDLRLKLIENGLRTAWAFTWDGASVDLAECLLEGLKQRI